MAVFNWKPDDLTATEAQSDLHLLPETFQDQLGWNTGGQLKKPDGFELQLKPIIGREASKTNATGVDRNITHKSLFAVDTDDQNWNASRLSNAAARVVITRDVAARKRSWEANKGSVGFGNLSSSYVM